MICIFCSYLTTIATNYAFDSSDVRFDNTGTDLDSVNVQDALDETFHHVTDYNDIKTTIGNGSLTTTSQNIIGAVNEINDHLEYNVTINNLNDTTLQGGNYYYTANSTGAPETTAGRLMQVKSPNSVWGGQIAVPNSSTFCMYARMLTSSGYRDWYQLASTDQIAKYYYGEMSTNSYTPNVDRSITVPIPTGATTVKAVIPYGFVPADHWNSTIVFTSVYNSTRTINFRVIGSGNAQIFSIKYIVIYA